ncbi:hypothetical protein ACFQE8_02110 [Salinirubellus sp. GCM10025818]
MEATERDERPEAARAAGAAETDDEHLVDVPDGCGCAEVWEHLSGRRA